MTLTNEQIEALIDSYSTLRAIYETDSFGHATRLTCCVSASLLVAAFPELAVLERRADDIKGKTQRER